ncbi:MAG TPA: HAMP domain-containing sensor histidine kinase [Gaiellaceae bacterium]|nr:HAMP domain-containing sensor histidine kinase [Gaiellaceae bacterium]
MTLRVRLTLVAAGVVAVVLATASLVVYFTMRHELLKQIDREIGNHAGLIQTNPRAAAAPDELTPDIVQVYGSRFFGSSSGPLPIDDRIRQVARDGRGGFYRTISVQGYHVREVVGPLPPPFDGAVVVGRVIDDVYKELSRLRLILVLVSLGGVGAAALAGALVSRATLAPVRRLTHAAERIAQTGEPSERVPESGRGELGRLGASFNTMLAALEESLETQRRFVADASHELRTPLTSLQTNIDVLRGAGRLDHEQRQRLLADLHRESQEMRSLIAGLLELARGDSQRQREELQFDELVEETVERARSRFPDVVWQARLEPTVVHGYPDRLERAVWNLLENAGKWGGDGSTVEVVLAGGELSVRDHGPGIAPEDRPLVFDRFYRSAAARALPGSGLGLAIVREIAEAHGGTAVAEEPEGGGALLRLSLNGAARPNTTLTDS